MTPAQPRSARSAPARGLLTLLVLFVAALTATATAVAAPTATATDPTVATADPAATPASVTDPGLAPTDAVTDTGASGGAAAPADTTATAAAAPDTASAPTPAITDAGPSAPAGAQADIRPQSPVLAAGAADTPLAHPAHDAASPVARGGILAPPIVSTSRSVGAPLKATLTQLDSGGPLVASSGVAGAAASRARQDQTSAPVGRHPSFAPSPQRTGAALIAVAVPILGVVVSSQAGVAHHAGTKLLGTTARTFGPSGLGSTSLTPLGHGPAGQTGGVWAVFGNAPFSSGAGVSPLLGLDTMLAAIFVIATIAWRRRAWDLPLLQGESALFSLALDRPG